MSYKTVLVHLDDHKRAEERLRIAADIAVTENAHLIGAAMTGVSKFLHQNAVLNSKDPYLYRHIDVSRERAAHALETFEPAAKKAGVTSFEKRVIDDEAGGGVCLQARYCDLVVIGQTNPDEPSSSEAADFPEYVLMNSGRPVLMVPYVGTFDTIGKRVLISWDASREATRAVTDAIPLLKHADLVQVVVFNTSADDKSGAHGEQPGADIALYLARHGINVEVSQQRTELDIGNALLSLATDFGSDLIVMGGYGHSRFREMLLGGVTRTILQTMTIPVFMSH
jgi:nucleotide-binding universal stress UspA family protein